MQLAHGEDGTEGGTGMSGNILRRYEAVVEAGGLTPDPAQITCIASLDALAADLEREAAARRSLLRRWRLSKAPLRGLYIHGSVGRGKTMLMDLFFETVAISNKRRLHFHAFMAEAHDHIADARKSHDGDPVPVAAKAIARNTHLLCFDELFVRDIADAMVLGRLFRGLFENGVVVVATSNAPPEDLYRGGLNRQLFLPFIDEIEERLTVFELTAARDYRLEKLSGRQLYFSPADAAARAALDENWLRLVGHRGGKPADLEVKGRQLHVPEAAMGVARFSFAQLCEAPLGPLDYLAIARAFHTVFIDAIPELGPASRNEARRFITLIDALYDNRVCLIASAAAEPDRLYPKGDGADLFLRTASRLTEMRSEGFLAGRAKRAH